MRSAPKPLRSARVDRGHGEESEESEEEHDVWRTYYEIYDNNFDYDL